MVENEVSQDNLIRPKGELLSNEPCTVNIPKIKQSPGLNDVVRKRLDFLSAKAKGVSSICPDGFCLCRHLILQIVP